MDKKNQSTTPPEQAASSPSEEGAPDRYVAVGKLGRISKKKLKKLKQGRGGAMEDILQLVAQHMATAPPSTDGKVQQPIVILYKRKKKKKGKKKKPKLKDSNIFPLKDFLGQNEETKSS